MYPQHPPFCLTGQLPRWSGWQAPALLPAVLRPSDATLKGRGQMMLLRVLTLRCLQVQVKKSAAAFVSYSRSRHIDQ